jgi:hypothetical protein
MEAAGKTMIKRFKGMFKLHTPCFIIHYYVGSNQSESHNFCLKCLKWEYPELHLDDEELA